MKVIDFKTAFYYPFNRLEGLLNVLWILLPIIGWLALFGYTIVIIKHFIRADFSALPKFDFKDNLNLGFWMFVKIIPLMLAYMAIQFVAARIPFIGLLATLFISLFVLPMLIINFFDKETVESSFELKKIKPVFKNIEEYLIVILKSVALQIIFLIMIIILVGLPAGMFTKNIFFADFYGKYVK